MGSPKFSLETLDILYNNENIDVDLVVSGKDKKRNRNMSKMTCTLLHMSIIVVYFFLSVCMIGRLKASSGIVTPKLSVLLVQ